MIRVVLVEDQTLVRQGLRSLLELWGEVEVAGEASTGDEALRLIPAVKPDVVLLDMRLPGPSGLDVLRGLAAAGFLPPTLVLTTFDDEALLLEAVRAGARGYLLKDVTFDQLTDAIRRLARGETFFQPAVTRQAAASLEKSPAHTDGFETPEALTARERETLRLMAGGYSNREIASAMGLSEGTVKNHVSSVLLKLGVRDRTRAVLKGLAEGLIG
ncbi:MAG TPA: response regulator transcription factor [Thermoanaerobaculia bacterium]|nr:response regulator transcription factor [Thermoanaerobaculia bacterium]